jgi:acyl phosphate:glycerol-3-phosphate acyltransferase
MILFFLVVSYLIGAIPFGLLFSKMVGKDVRSEGSRNIGATNVSRVLGKKLGFLTLICDCLKSYLPMVAAAALLPAMANRELAVTLCGMMAVLGHIFPVYLGFKGGKGVASGLGMFMYLSPLATLISLGVFIAAVALSGFVSVGSLLAAGFIPLWLWLLDVPACDIYAAMVVAALIWLKHRENIGRLWRREEKSWKKK